MNFLSILKIFMNILNLTKIVLYVDCTLLHSFHLLIHIKICIVFMKDGLLEVYKGGALKDLWLSSLFATEKY